MNRDIPGSPAFDASPPDLSALITDIWKHLDDVPGDLEHPWRTPGVATVGPDSRPHVRSVVVRDVVSAQRRLVFHTDSRTAKLDHVREQTHVEWLLYDPRIRLQLRIAARTTIHTRDAFADEQWDIVGNAVRRMYLAEFRPGTPCDAPSYNATDQLNDDPLNDTEFRTARERFTAIETIAQHVDWLLLKREGNLAAQFEYDGQQWRGTWRAP